MKVVLVDGVGNAVVHEVLAKVLPVTIDAAARTFVRTGETVPAPDGDLQVFRLRGGKKLIYPPIRHVNHKLAENGKGSET